MGNMQDAFESAIHKYGKNRKEQRPYLARLRNAERAILAKEIQSRHAKNIYAHELGKKGE